MTINDCYKLDHYPRVATAVNTARAEAEALGCVVSSHLNGDFLSPCSLTAVDGGRGMTEGLNLAKIDYVCLGNHEFDFGFDVIATRVKQFKGKCVNSNVPDERLDNKLLPKYDVMEVGDKKVLVAGLLTGDTSIYAPSNTPKVTQPAEAAVAVWEEAKVCRSTTRRAALRKHATPCEPHTPVPLGLRHFPRSCAPALVSSRIVPARPHSSPLVPLAVPRALGRRRSATLRTSSCP